MRLGRLFLRSLGILLATLIIVTIVLLVQWRLVPSNLPTTKGPNSWIIDNVNIIDVETGSVLANKALELQNGKIARIAAQGAFSETELQRIDAKGAYLVPGLVDMHVHVYDRRELTTNLAYGVTSVRNLRGFPSHLRWRKELNEGDWLGARLYTASPVLSGRDHAHALQQIVETPEHARELVRRYQNDGYDMIKAYGFLKPEVFTAIVDEANALGMPIAKHAPHGPNSVELSALSGMQSLEHVEDVFQGPLGHEFNEDKLNTYLTELSNLNTFVTPTLATFDHLTQLSLGKEEFVSSLNLHHINPFIKELLGNTSVQRWLDADEEMASWNQKKIAYFQHITKRLHETGIPLLVGSDAGTMYMSAGFSTHREMQLMQDAGIPSADVIRAATLNPATAMGIETQYGKVAEGYVADLVLVKNNPLTSVYSLESPDSVFYEGHYLDQAALTQLMADAGNTSSYLNGFLTVIEDIAVRALH
jgi:imidazolonepropionase-like amidohydrolase